MKTLTIFTPTYNRCEKLKEAYKSLINQDNKNFVWLIVDDGSTDGTRKIVDCWKKEKRITIDYYWKNNGGKHTAINMGLRVARTKFIMLSLDSDDVMSDSHAIGDILRELEQLKDEVGIIALCNNKTAAFGKKALVKHYDVSILNGRSLKDAYSRDLFDAECRMIMETDYVKQFQYPEIEGEKFFTDAYIYWLMEKKVKWTNVCACLSDYLPDGLTNNRKALYKHNPRSWFLYNQMRFLNTKKLSLKMKFLFNMTVFRCLSDEKMKIDGCAGIIALSFYPLAFMVARVIEGAE